MILKQKTKTRTQVTHCGCNTPVLTPFALNVYDVYIVINHGVGLKAKSPPSIWLFYVSTIKIVADGISCYPTHIDYGIM